MSNLRSTITALTAKFADGVLRALHSAPLSELTALGGAGPSRRTGDSAKRATGDGAGPKRGRLPTARPGARRNAKDFEKLAAAIVSVVGEAGATGLRSEQIQKALGLTKKDVVRPIQIALSTKQLKKKGQRRGTTYFAS